MANIPAVFRKGGEGIIASYDWYAFGEGTGIKLFYAATTSNDEILTESQVYSDDIELGANTNQTTFTLLVDKDFDLSPFNLPKDLYGTAYFNYTMGNESNSDCYMHIYIRKYSGTTETEIANASGAAFIHGVADGEKTELLSIPITTKVHFKKGDILRITVNLYGRVSATSGDVYFGVDPMNRDGTAITPSTTSSTTQFKCWLPFRTQG